MNKQQYTDQEKIFKLKHGEECNINWSEGGGSVVYRVYDMYFLFEVPHYGGKPQFVSSFNLNQIEELIEKSYSFT